MRKSIYRSSDNTTLWVLIFQVLFVCAALFGEGRCIYKAFTCNWEPIGKAEILYTASACCGLGAIVGYFNIEDK